MTVVLEPSRRLGDPRHVFVDAGDGATLHLWEAPDGEIFGQPIEPWPPRGVPGSLQHLVFKLPAEAAREVLRQRLRAHGVGGTEVFEQGPVRLRFFRDPEGLTLEAGCRVGDISPD